MSWKKSKDGGIDYDVEYIIKTWEMQERHRIAREKMAERYPNAKERLFNVAATACTMTFDTGDYPEVEFDKPLTAQEKLQRFRANKHREVNKNYGAYKK